MPLPCKALVVLAGMTVLARLTRKGCAAGALGCGLQLEVLRAALV